MCAAGCSPFLNGKIERAFRTFRIWWRRVLCGLSRRNIQRRIDDYRHWYNHHRPHSALGGLAPEEAKWGVKLPTAIAFQAADPAKPYINIRRLRCRGDPLLPMIEIHIRRAA